MLPLATAAPWTLVLLLLPLAVAAWVLRAGVDIDDDGAHRARRWSASGRSPWDELAGIRVGRRGDLWLVTTAQGTEVRLPVLRARDLPRLAALSGGRIAAPDPLPAGSRGRSGPRTTASVAVDDVRQRLAGQHAGELVGDRGGRAGVRLRHRARRRAG